MFFHADWEICVFSYVYAADQRSRVNSIMFLFTLNDCLLQKNWGIKISIYKTFNC